MKNLTARITKIVSAILLVFGTIFATVFMNTPSSYVYAVENDTSGNNIQLDDEPEDNNQNTNPGNNIEIDNPNPDNNGNNVNIDDTPSDPSNPGNNVEIDDSDSPADPDNPENPGTEDLTPAKAKSVPSLGLSAQPPASSPNSSMLSTTS